MEHSAERLTRFGLTLCAGLLLVACDGPRHAAPAVTTPVAAGLPADDGYAISGTVRDTNRQAVPGARVEVIAPGFEGKAAISDSLGWYRIPDLAGGVQVQATKNGYFSDGRAATAAERTLVNFTLQPIERMTAGRAIQAVLTDRHPVCVDPGSGARAEFPSPPCQRYLLTASSSGTLELVVTCDSHARLGLDVIAPNGESAQSIAGAGRTMITFVVERGSTYEVRVLGDRNGFRASEDFELTATMK